MHRRHILTAIALALGAAAPALAADPLKIGLVLPMTGPSRSRRRSRWS
jgi:branched-chain amino acid transport system substrate-binding protein